MTIVEKEINGKVTEIHSFGYDEFIQWCNERSGKFLSKTGKNSEDYDSKGSFTGVSTWNKCIELGLGGWDEGTTLVKRILDQYEVIGKGVTFYPKFEVSGESVDIGRYLSNDPECMMEWEQIETVGRKVVDIYFNNTASAFVETNQMINYGSAVLSFIDHLESLGIRVNLYVFIATQLNMCEHNACLKLKVKSADDALNLPMAAYAICHPSVLRRLYFKFVEHNDHLYQSNYGRPCNLSKNDLIEDGLDEAIVFNGIGSELGFYFRSTKDVDRWINEKTPRFLNDLKIDTKYNKEIMADLVGEL